jgi:hypothetical protein
MAPKLESEGEKQSSARRRAMYDLEMLEQMGFCHGIENYSRHLSGLEGEPPPSADYFPKTSWLSSTSRTSRFHKSVRVRATDPQRPWSSTGFGCRAHRQSPAAVLQGEARVGRHSRERDAR